MAKTKECLTVTGAAKGNDILPTAESIYREVLRAKRGGFSATEYERARDEFMSRVEKVYNNRNSQETGSYVQQYVRHFIDNEPIPSIDWYYTQMQTLSKMVSVNEINQLIQEVVTDNNRVLLAMMPEKDDFKFPTESEMAAVMKAVDAEEIEAFVDNVKEEPLIPSLPAAGKIVKTGRNAMWDAEEWTLSNGVKVLVKTTKFKDDEIVMSAIANEGLSRVLKNIDIASYQAMSLVTGSYGINSYTNSDLQKYLQGKQAGVSLSFGSYQRSVSGSTTPKDLPVMMELLYGVFTGFNVSADEFKALQDLYVGLLQNQEANPQFVFSRDVAKAIYKSPYRQVMSVDDVKNASREVILNTVRGQLANAADYTFVFVGNVDPEALKPLVEQYIATLPAKASKATKRVAKTDPALCITPGNGRDEFTTKMEN
ncbi:MAG: hypothetical protein K2L49_06145, partial [Muribaculaceae bacterium]|nr:hypothetical protein [Muribaculaceae bacterium]